MFMIKKTPSLRFLLALGGKKVVVMQDQEDMHVYSDQTPRSSRVFVERISNAVAAR